MNFEIDKELYHVIVQTLSSCLSPDKAVIDQAQQQLFVLQIRPGNKSLLFVYFK
jgi:hypothetical protein